MISGSTTFKELLATAREFNAAVTKVVVRDEDDKPLYAFVVIQGDETAEVIDAIEAVENSWDAKEEGSREA